MGRNDSLTTPIRVAGVEEKAVSVSLLRKKITHDTAVT